MRPNVRGGLRTDRAVTYAILLFAAMFTLSPIFWVLTTSFKPNPEAISFPPSLIPENPSLENYSFVLTDPFLVRSFLNSILVGLGSTALSVSACTLAGYALARFRFKGKNLIISFMLGVFMIPAVMNVIPLFLMLKDLGMLDTYAGLILTYQILVIPLNTFLLKNYFETIPTEMEEAAMVDGSSRLGAFFRVTLPLSWPGLAVASILSFRFSWNEFILPFTLTSSREMSVFQVALFRLISIERIEWGFLTAGIMLGMLPVLVMLIFFQRQMVRGLTMGATKG